MFKKILTAIVFISLMISSANAMDTSRDTVAVRQTHKLSKEEAESYKDGLKHFKAKDDWKKTFECFQRAANANHPASQFYVGMLYELGLGIEQSLDEAAKWYTKALAGPEACEEALPSLRRVIQKKGESL